MTIYNKNLSSEELLTICNMHANYKVRYDNTMTYNVQEFYIYILKKRMTITFFKTSQLLSIKRLRQITYPKADIKYDNFY